jgi:hypothetical protein
VHTLEPHAEGCRVHALRADTGEPLSLEARHVIYCGPRFTVPHVLAPWRREAPAFVRAFTYAPWVVANLTVSERPGGSGFPPAWDNVLYESRSLGYVTNTHQVERQREEGPCVLTWYYPFSREAPQEARALMLGADYGAWEELVMADLRVPHPELARTARRLEVMRWGHAMVRPTPGFLWGAARAAAAAPVGCVHFAHADLGGMSLFEEANHFGVQAAEAVLARMGRPGPTWL